MFDWDFGRLVDKFVHNRDSFIKMNWGRDDGGGFIKMMGGGVYEKLTVLKP